MIRKALIRLLESATKSLQSAPEHFTDDLPKIRGNGSYLTEVAGESHYQAALKKVAGEKTQEGKQHKCVARITPEPDNAWDKNACAVFIHNMKVGYLPAVICKDYLRQLKANGFKKTDSLAVDALITGGWKDHNGEGHYGVKLDLPWIE